MRQSRAIILNAGFSFIRQVVNMLVRLMLLGYVLHRVDEKAYGLFLIAIGLQRFVIHVRDAISRAAVVRLAGTFADGDTETASRVLSSAAVFLMLPAAVLLCGLPFLGRPVAVFFETGPALQEKMAWILALAGLDIALTLPLTPYTSVLEARQRYGLLAIADTGSRLLRAALIVVLFETVEPNVVYVMAATVAGDVAMRVAAVGLARRLAVGMRFGLRYVDWTVLKSLIAYGSYIVYGSILFYGAQQAVRWLLGKLKNVEHVTFVTVADYPTVVMRTIVQTMTVVLVPAASRYQSLGKKAGLQQMLLRGTRYSSVLSMGTMVVLLPAIGPLLGLWLKPGLAWLGPYAFALGATSALTLPHNCAVQVLNGLGDTKRPFFATMTDLGATVVLVAVLVGWLGWGLGGAVLALVAGRVMHWFLPTYFACKDLEVRPGTFAWHAYLQPLLAAAPAFAAGAFAARWLQPGTWGSLVLVWLISGGTFVLFFLPHVTAKEWDLLRGLLRRIASWIRRGGTA